MPRTRVGDSSLEKITISSLIDTYVMANPPLERLLFDRNLIGLEFAQCCQEASEAFLGHFADEISALGADLAELVVLSKGIYYWMHNAFAVARGENLEANFIATKRASVSGTSVTIEVPYCDVSAPASNLIVADTVASGATMVAALEHYLRLHPLRQVFVFTIAGSGVGGRTLAEFCARQSIKLTIVYGLAAFGLADNGFDLSFLHPETVCPNREYVRRAFDLFEGQPVSAVGWDFGSQVQAVKKYKMLCWIEAEYWGLQNSDVFRIKEMVTEPQLVAKEAAAYEKRVRVLPATN